MSTPFGSFLHRALLGVVLVITFSASAVQAWGPSTHVALSEALLERVAADPRHPLRFLLVPALRERFVRASMSPDMTVSIFSGRKVDPTYNKLFHDQAIGRDMVERAQESDDREGVAFALGWLGHAIADQVMSRGGGIIYKDLFGLPHSTKRRLGHSLTTISKFAIDALVIRDLAVPQFEPLVERLLLVEALKASRKGATLADPDDSIASFHRSFSWTCSTVYSLASSVGSNTKAFPDCIHELADVDEDCVDIPGFEDSVDAMEQALTDALVAPIPAGSLSSTDAATPTPGFGTRLLAKAGRLVRRTGSHLWNSNAFALKLRQVALEQSLKVMNSLGGDGTLDGRILVTFAGDMVNGTHTWPEIRERIRKLATAGAP